MLIQQLSDSRHKASHLLCLPIRVCLTCCQLYHRVSSCGQAQLQVYSLPIHP
jgi:hypothetical protein